MSVVDKINESAKDTDAELVVIELYKKLMADRSIKGTDIVFADITADELATALESAWGCIDILKFELGES